MSKQEIETKIANLKEEYQNVKGTKCECYQRVVGYYRNVNNWNIGKVEEYKDRKEFAFPVIPS
jgi:anaerobic ribonucleoside-triphosphate reductase